MLLEGGWIRTGDIVVMDDDGFVTIVDRIKELIITGGFNVYPSEVEDALRRIPGVADAAVVGLPHESGGETVVAAVVADPGDAARPRGGARRASREHLTGYKVPRQVFVLDELPRSLIGKVLHRAGAGRPRGAPRPPLTAGLSRAAARGSRRRARWRGRGRGRARS